MRRGPPIKLKLTMTESPATTVNGVTGTPAIWRTHNEGGSPASASKNQGVELRSKTTFRVIVAAETLASMNRSEAIKPDVMICSFFIGCDFIVPNVKDEP